MKEFFILMFVCLGSIAYAGSPAFKCGNGTLEDSAGTTLQNAYFRFVPSTIYPQEYVIERGAGGEGGWYVEHYYSYARPSDLVQLVAQGQGADTINGVPVRTYESDVIAERQQINGPWSVRHTVRIKTNTSDKTFTDIYHFESEDCGWH